MKNIKTGHTATILSVEGEYSVRLLGLGIRPGREIAVIRRGKGLIQVRVGNTDVIMRKEIAEDIGI